MRKVDWMVLAGTNVVTALLCWALFSKSGSVEGLRREAGDVIAEKRSSGDEDAPVSGKVAHRDSKAEVEESGEDADYSPALPNQVSESGALSSEVMRKYGLSQEQYVKMQSALSTYWAAMAKSAAERISYDAVASEAAPDGAEVYRLPAMEKEERERLCRELVDSLRETGGEKAAREITGGFGDGSSFGYHGRLDIVFRFKPMKVIQFDASGNETGSYVDKSQMMVSFEGIDPVRGEAVVEGHSTSKDLANSYGNIFVVPAEGGAGK